MELDSTDLSILRILQKHGRMPIVELAKHIHLTTTPCADRVKRLEKNGIIESYHAKISPEKLGLTLLVLIHVRLDQSSIATVFEQFERDIQLLDEVEECFSLTGEFDAMLKVRVADMTAYQRFMSTKLTKISGIIQTRSEVIIKQLKSSHGIALS